MTLPSADETLLRRYLLGTVTDEARKDLDARLFSDDRIFWERISIAEDELVSDYVQNALNQVERQDFEHHFLCTDERRAKLEFAKTLHAYAAGTQPQSHLARESRWAWLRRPMVSPAWALAAAALLVLAIQVPRFGATSTGDAASDVIAISLPAGRTRAAGGELTRVHLNANSRIVRLQLEAESSRFAAYRAGVYHVDDDALLAEMRVAPPASAGSSEMALILPAELLTEGDYYIQLQGIAPGAAPVPLQRYDFRVLRN